MQIFPISYINKYSNNYKKTSPRVNMTQPMDAFVKSPSFKGAEYNKVAPFLLDGIEYTKRNLKNFDQVMESINFKNRTDYLLKALTENVFAALGNRLNKKDLTFAVDFMLRTGDSKNLQEMCKLNLDAVFKALPKIKFSDETKPNVLSLLKDVAQSRYYADRIPYCMYNDAIQNDNVPLLKTLIKDTNWGLFKRHELNDRKFNYNELNIIRDGQDSNNPEIKELFNGKNLYNLISQYNYIYSLVRYDMDTMFDLIMVYLYETPDSNERSQKADNIAATILDNGTHYYKEDGAEYLSEMPLTNYERNVFKQYYNDSQKQIVQKAIKMRVEKIIQRNGIDTPEQILACMNDKIMTPDLLTVLYRDFTLLDKIAEMPVTKDSKPYMSKIIEKLSETSNYPDNDMYRGAAIKAAKQGNAELLKFFDSKHVHFANALREPIDRFPENVREILENAKVNDTELLQYAKFPKFIESYLKVNPKSDINSKTPAGESLLSLALKLKSMEALKTLAKRDDVDWNITNENGDNLLMQILDFWGRDFYDRNANHDLDFKKKAIKLLRELPDGKFDVNYINKAGSLHHEKPYTALSKLFTFHEQEYQLFDDILKFKNIDTNLDPTSGRPLILHAVSDVDYFKKLFLHPNTDTTLIKDEDFEQFKERGSRIDHGVIQFLKKQEDKAFVNIMKKRYEENGMFELEEIKDFVNNDKFAPFANTKFNIFGENIAHLLTDIFPDMTNPTELKLVYDIVEKLSESKFDFQMKDELGRTPYEKAVEGENVVIADLLEKYQ